MRPIIAVTREQPYALAVTQYYHSVAFIFDLMQPKVSIRHGFGGTGQAWQVRCGHARDLCAGFLNRESSNFAIAPRASWQTLTLVDSRGRGAAQWLDVNISRCRR